MSLHVPAMTLAALAIVGAAGPRAQEPFQDVIRNLRHPKAESRLDAVTVLNNNAYAPAAEAVAPLVADADDRVQAAAIDAELTFFLTESINPVRVMGIGSQKSRAQEAFDGGPLIRGSAPAPSVLVDKLILAIRDENPRIRFDAVHALGFIAEAPLSAPQAAALVAELDHYDPIIRTATARVLARLRVTSAADKLVAATVDSNALVRQFAVLALGRAGEPRVTPQLRQMLTSNKGQLRSEALLALAELASNDDLGLFRTALTESDPEVRRAGAEGLGRLADRDSLAALDAAFKTDRSAAVRLAAAFALQRLDQPQSHVIAAAIGDRDLTSQARDYLFELGVSAMPGVEAAFKVAVDSRARADLLQLMGYLRAPGADAIVEPFTRDQDVRVSRAATHALIRLRR
jgi:HEAT repeat protein